MAFVYESNNGISVCTRACRLSLLARAERETARLSVHPLRAGAREIRGSGRSVVESRGGGDSFALFRGRPFLGNSGASDSDADRGP